jgi:hypothetical protein
MFVIPVTLEVKIGRIVIRGQSGQKVAGHGDMYPSS